MRYITRTQRRRGSVLPLVAICTIALMGMLALAIDIGMVCIARSQAQNAADSAAMAGARTITGTAGQNYAQVPINAVTAATDNYVFGTPVQGSPKSISNPSTDVFVSGQVTVQCGGFSYVYNDSNPSAEGFQLTMPGKPAGEPYSAVQVTINTTSPTSFGRVFGLNSFNVSATSAAVQRPRDVIIIMDLSGSMRFESLPGCYVDSTGTAYPHFPNVPRNTSLNPDTVFPQFGHYSAVAAAALQGTKSYPSTDVSADPSNISTTSNAGPPVIADFMTSGSTQAFSLAPSTYATTPGGDDFPKYSGSYVNTVNALLNNTTNQSTMLTFCRTATAPSVTGYAGNGYTAGPNYWGKTFYVWPPDPRGSDLDANNAANHANNGALDWRQRFFIKKNMSTSKLYWCDHNTLLYNPAGSPSTTSTINTAVKKSPGSGTTTTVTENGQAVSYCYLVNYAAIFTWLKSNPVHFPSSMTTGRINYYSALPDPTDTTLNNRFWTTATLTNNNEQFWRSYVDFVLGFYCTGAGTWSNMNPNGGSIPLSCCIGSGDYFMYNSNAIQITQKADCSYTGAVNLAAGYGLGTTVLLVNNIKNFSGTTVLPVTGDFIRFNYGSTIYQITSVTSAGGVSTITLDQGLKAAVANGDLVRFWSASNNFPAYMNYNDNPYRPRHHHWFGPMTFVDWLGNYTTYQFWWPGNVHEAQAWACKVGIQTAIDDMQNNHPNDYIGMAFFSTPMTSATDTSGRHNNCVVPLGQSYQSLKDSLWFPPSTVNAGVATIGPYDADMQNVPRAAGGTAPMMGFMIAYNLLSSSVTNLRNYAQPEPTYRGNAGGLGRKGAGRMIIFDTDGAPNTRAFSSIVSSGADSYYPVRIKYPTNLPSTSNEFPSGGTYADSEVYAVVQQICAQDTASPPGYSNARRQAAVYCIGYGTMFDPSYNSGNQPHALNFLQSIQYYAGTSPDTTGANFPDWQRIYGTNDQRISRMQTAFTNILQTGVQVSIIK
jgi:Flp pilus assembly protein TadG